MSLKGYRVLELAGLAPVPFCGMVLADFGADVIRVDRVGGGRRDFLSRGKRSIQVDLKHPEGRKLILEMCEKADVLIEPFRPGVMEKLGLGPDECRRRNKKLVYARLTGFGQAGPAAQMAGHDINYLAAAGVLAQLGRAGEPPQGPQNLLADFAGGGLMCAMGILMALLERKKSGMGQVVDCAMVDGAAYLASMSYVARNMVYGQERGKNMLDGGAPFYEVYETADRRYMACGAIEPQFYKNLLRGLDIPLEDDLWSTQLSTDLWPEQKERFAKIFKTKTQKQWTAIYENLDACVSPVLSWTDLESDAHAKARGLLVDVDGEIQIRPAPLLSRTPAKAGSAEPEIGQHTEDILSKFVSRKKIAKLRSQGVIDGEPKAKL